MVWATQHFRPYLYGCSFLLRSDHSALQWLHSFKEPEGQVARWLERLAEYNYRVEHRPGRQHSNADSLSRLPCKQCGLAIVNESSCAVLTQDTSAGFIPVWTQEEIKNFQREDDNLLQVIRWVETDFPSSSPKLHSLQTLWAQRDYLLLQDEVLYRQWEDEHIRSCSLFYQHRWYPRFWLDCMTHLLVVTWAQRKHWIRFELAFIGLIRGMMFSCGVLVVQSVVLEKRHW